MSPPTTKIGARLPSIGVDAVALDRYSGIHTGDGGLIVYDEEVEVAWIQSNEWVSAQGNR